jgi:Hsp70 protein
MGDADLSVSVTREQFEELNAPLFTRCIDTVREVLADAKITIEQVHAASQHYLLQPLLLLLLRLRSTIPTRGLIVSLVHFILLFSLT